MLEHLRPCYAEINLDNLRHNFREVKKLVKDKKIFGVIKADGYGHGVIEIARVLKQEGVDAFAVAVITEAIELRRNGFMEEILVLGYTPSTFSDTIVENNISQTIFDYESAKSLSKEAKKQEKIAKIHIKIDTGMGRIGLLDNDNIVKEIEEIKALPNIKIEGIFSHFSTSDEKDKTFSYNQLEKFNSVIKKLEKGKIDIKTKHMSNSGAIVDIEEAYFDAVRPGILLYGYYPSDEVRKERINLKPVMTLKTNIVHIKEIEKGTPISYGRKYIAKSKIKVATIPIGYADGFSRLFFNKGNVIINGILCPVIGTICMDQCMVDISGCENVKINDEVIVIGESKGINLNADIVAKALGTISYEILCMISKRVPRVYIEKNEIIRIKNFI